MSESTYQIDAPGAWADDIQSAMESWAMDLDDERNAGKYDGMREVLAQYEDPSRTVKRGRGYVVRFDLTLAGVKALREEALYRWEFHGGNDNPYGTEDPEPAKRRAAKALIDRCDAVLQGAP